MKWWDWMPWSLFFERWVLSQVFHSPLSPSSRKRLSSSSSVSAIRMVSSAYLKLFIFLPAILISIWAPSSPAFHMIYSACAGFPGGSVVKNPPTVQEIRVQFLGWEDPLEKGMATHRGIVYLLGESHGQRSLAGYSPWGHKDLDMIEGLTFSLSVDIQWII